MSASFTSTIPAVEPATPVKPNAPAKANGARSIGDDRTFKDAMRQADGEQLRGASHETEATAATGETCQMVRDDLATKLRFDDLSFWSEPTGTIEAATGFSEDLQATPAAPTEAAPRLAQADAVPVVGQSVAATIADPVMEGGLKAATGQGGNAGGIELAQKQAASSLAQAEVPQQELTAEPVGPDETEIENAPEPFGETLRSASNDLQAKSIASQAPQARPTPEVVPLDHVAVHIAKSAGKGSDKIQIQLTPLSLGTIDVDLEVGHDGRIDVVVRADKPETMELLQRDARQLVRALQDAGLQADSSSLSFELRDQGGQQDRQARPESRAANDNGGHAVSGFASEAVQPPRRVTLGGVDILA